MFDSKPVGKADDCSQIAGVLHIVQCQAKGAAYDGNIHRFVRLFEHGEYLLGSFQQAGARKFLFGNFGHIFHSQMPVGGKPFGSCNQEAATEVPQQISYQFRAFCQEYFIGFAIRFSIPVNGYI